MEPILIEFQDYNGTKLYINANMIYAITPDQNANQSLLNIGFGSGLGVKGSVSDVYQLIQQAISKGKQGK